MNYQNFFTTYVFEVNESISRSFTKLPESGDLENPGPLPVSEVLMDRSRLGLMDIHNFFNPTFSRSEIALVIGSHRSRFKWRDQFDLW